MQQKHVEKKRVTWRKDTDKSLLREDGGSFFGGHGS